MRIDFLGHAAFLLTSEGGVRVLIDPYESGGFGGRVGYAPITEVVDLVVITHDHLDHCHTDSLPPGFEVIRHAGESHGVRVRSVEAFHDEVEGTRFGGVIDMKIIEMDGLRLLHAGDLGQRLNEEHLRAIGPIDILIVPVGGFYTLDAEGAAAVAEQLSPGVVIPCHYLTGRCGFDIAGVEPFVERFESVLRPGGSAWEVVAGAVPVASTCVWLEPRL